MTNPNQSSGGVAIKIANGFSRWGHDSWTMLRSVGVARAALTLA
jgi:hypothetical protein